MPPRRLHDPNDVGANRLGEGHTADCPRSREQRSRIRDWRKVIERVGTLEAVEDRRFLICGRVP
jgi:hypothetical protein